MLAVIDENGPRKERLEIEFTRLGDGMRAAEVERLHRDISEILEAIVLDEPVNGL
jgi:hypothetical protein